MKKKTTAVILAAILVLMLLLGACTTDFHFNIGTAGNSYKKTSQETKSIPLNGTRNLKIVNVTGNITVTKSDGDDIQLITDSEVTGSINEEVMEVLGEIRTSAEYLDGVLMVKAVTVDGQDFWKWLGLRHPGVRASIGFTLNIPQHFEHYDLSLVTGNVDMRKLAGVCVVSNTTGNITLQDTAPKGRNSIKLVTGNIDLAFSDLSEADEVAIENVTGNINLKVPEHAGIELNAKLTTGKLLGALAVGVEEAPGGNTLRRTFGDGHTTIHIANVTGSINLSN